MKQIVHFLALLITVSTAICGTVGIETSARDLSILGDLGKFSVRYNVFVADENGVMQKVPPLGVSPDASAEQTPLGLVFNLNGTSATLTSTATVDGNKVNITTGWPQPVVVDGFWFQELLLPEAFTRDLRIDIDGAKVFPNDAPVSSAPRVYMLNSKNVSQISFKSDSTGAPLFEVQGKFPNVRVSYHPSQPVRGVVVELYSHGDNKGIKMADVPESNWSIVFP